MKLAEQMGCTVVEAKGRTTQWELMAWIAYWDLQQEANRKAAQGEDPRKRVQAQNAMENRRRNQRGRR